MSDAGNENGEQQTYWNQLVLVKEVACYVRRYRDEQAWWVNRLGLFKVVMTSGTIGAWGVWKDYAFIWAVLLGGSQIIDAAKDFIPQIKHRRSANACATALENLFIDARFEWYAISIGKIQSGEIMERWRSLAKLLAETEAKYFPEGLPSKSPRLKLAQDDARAYMISLYSAGARDRG